MNRRKIKKAIKKVDDFRFRKIALSSLKLIRVWEKLKHRNSKSNMRILTNNFYRNGEFI
jgi:hypothetical protein